MSQGSSLRISLAVLACLAYSHLAAPDASALDQYPGDTVIYGATTETIQPNVLVILDNSGSMADSIISGDPYTPATIYASVNACNGQSCLTNKVYRWRSTGGGTWVSHINDVNTISCNSARNSFLQTGLYQGRLRTNGSCSSTSGSFALGNYINWLTATGGYRPKMDVAQEVLTNLVNSTEGAKFGLMIFNSSNGGHIAGVGDSYGYGGYDAYIKDMDEIFSGTTTNRTAYVNTVNNVEPTTWTPLAETMFEAMRYFQGGATAFNGTYTYTSPIEYSCQKNYIILITDGMSTEDRSSVLRSICNNGDCDGDGHEPANDPDKEYDSNGSDYLDDVAKYIYETDLLPDTGEERTFGRQFAITYTVGFGLAGVDYAEQLLEETAYNGGGEYYSANSTSGLSESLRRILATIVEDNTSFVAPVLPVSPENRTYSGNRIYMGFFKPKNKAFWSGNLKKFGLDSDGNVTDSNGAHATNSDGSIRDNATSFWSLVQDGGDVERGGAGEALVARTAPRNIYTYTGSSTDLTDPTNLLLSSNTAVTTAMLDVADATERDRLIDYVHGYDSYDEDGNGITDELRAWIMGDVLHSKPQVVNYDRYSYVDEDNCGVNESIVLVGSNDGMLHAFSDCDGSEKWAFIPPDLLGNLKHMPAAVHTYFVDSSPVAYTYDANGDGRIDSGSDKVIVIFGERRGGGYYYALDVTDPDQPVYLWRISSTESPSGVNTEYAELAESWSEPVFARVRVNVGGVIKKKVVAIIGAGYDNLAEDSEPAVASTTGRGIYVIEVADITTTGSISLAGSGWKLWGYTRADDAGMTKSILSQPAVLDIDGNGYADTVYIGDLGGYMWRLNIGSTLTSSWDGTKIFSSGGSRKIFYKPSVTLEPGYELIFFGTGDRAHPLSTNISDRLYALKDNGQTTAKTEGDLVDATDVDSVSIASSYGWYIELEGSGEKALAGAAAFGKVAYYTTYIPASDVGVCTTDSSGTSVLYAASHLTAAAAYNYNPYNDPVPDGDDVDDEQTSTKDRTDRSKVIGSGIASGIVTSVGPGGFSALIGSGGAIIKPDVNESGSSIPLYWREVR
ncbi:MAG: hypothetical protein H3C68_02890 [Deltaproteobacteria bacterium]|nr:hypothetical protein [Deltaproteobacteria bacterium]MBZ0221234.1 hypothetical protein [Deltaproteobacteria bacterium]